MKVNWHQLPEAVPEVQEAITSVCSSKNWYTSKAIWYNIIKAGVTVLSALGLYGVMSEEDMKTISTGVAVLVPVVATLFDTVANIWLRLRTNSPIVGTVAEKVIKLECKEGEIK